MNIKKILLNAFLLLIIFGLLMLCVISDAFSSWLALIGVGVPMWVFVILIVLIVNTFYQAQILRELRSMRNDQTVCYPEEYQGEDR